MTIPVDQLVQQIHDAPTRIVVAASGGGSRAIADLLDVPGASRTLLAAFVPYSNQAMIDFLGSRPDEFCSNRTARAMAMAAFLHACKLGQADSAARVAAGNPSSAENLAGVACTAGLVTDRPRRGSHRVFVALQTAAITASWSLELLKGRRSRPEEERVAGRLLINAVAESCGLEARSDLDLLEGEIIQYSSTVALPSWQDLLLGNVECAFQGGHALPPAAAGQSSISAAHKPIPSSAAVLSGAFNPLHVGHRRIADVGADLLKKPVIMEITILNPDKPPLDYYEIDRRTKQFPPEQQVCLTRAATFVEKARLFPGATFLVGADTLRRIAMNRYYHDDSAACRTSLEYIAQRGCRFLVFGRNMGTGFMQLADLDLPDVLRNICRDVPPEIFREDVSSTSIRNAGAW
jgi:nicotinamide mononucleotide (NMN) deamidase PncC